VTDRADQSVRAKKKKANPTNKGSVFMSSFHSSKSKKISQFENPSTFESLEGVIIWYGIAINITVLVLIHTSPSDSSVL